VLVEVLHTNFAVEEEEDNCKYFAVLEVEANNHNYRVEYRVPVVVEGEESFCLDSHY
jgi:hypothetical protein